MSDQDEARALAALLLATPDKSPATLQQGVVDTVDGGGRLHVFISGMEDSVGMVRYLASYTPTAGDTVWLITNGNDRFVLGELA